MFKLAPLFGDRAVLPRDKELRIFGSAEEGIRLTAWFPQVIPVITMYSVRLTEHWLQPVRMSRW